jgi:hypothetical protein
MPVFVRGTEKNHEQSHLEYPVSGPTFGPGISKFEVGRDIRLHSRDWFELY